MNVLEMSITVGSKNEQPKSLNCYCKGYCPHEEEDGRCETKPGGKCFTTFELEVDETGKEQIMLFYGCLPPDEMALFQCRSKLSATKHGKNLKCCDEYDFCNNHLTFGESGKAPKKSLLDEVTLSVFISSFLICLTLIAIVLVLVFLKHRKKTVIIKTDLDKLDDVESGKTINVTNVNSILSFPIGSNVDKGIQIVLDTSQSMPNTSFELPGLVQMTIAKQIQMESLVASGTYGELWTAKWRDGKVAVKIYNLEGEQFWRREADIYQSVVMRHENILGFIAADNRVSENKQRNQFLVITEYHERGCLRDFLKHNTIDSKELLQMTKGLASGLNHLHIELYGCKGKPAVAHNNINSSNILVKRNKECCWSDFKRAVKFTTSNNILDVPLETTNSQTRYLAPEILENKMDPNNFESFKMSDIYSFSLVLWEMASRCQVDTLISSKEYQLPYDDMLTSHNETEFRDIIFEIVVRKKQRPFFNEQWGSEPILNTVSKVINECWNPNPTVRLTALRIKKNLLKMFNENY